MNCPIIVLEGLDACGKSTQTELLIKNLREKNFAVERKIFPGYEKTPAGARIAAYLRGEFGGFEKIDPKIIASIYAADRLFQIDEIQNLRQKNDILIFDRGVTSNLIYTPAHGENPAEIADLQNFVEQLEYKIFGFPRESLVIFLDASEIARQKIHAAKNRPADLHEIDEKYLQKVREIALQICEKNFQWQKIAVDFHGELRPRAEIADEILNLILEKLQKNKK